MTGSDPVSPLRRVDLFCTFNITGPSTIWKWSWGSYVVAHIQDPRQSRIHPLYTVFTYMGRGIWCELSLEKFLDRIAPVQLRKEVVSNDWF